MENSDIGRIVQNQRAFFRTGKTMDVAFRREQLGILKRAMLSNTREILAALKQDMNKPAFEAYVA